MKVIVANRKAGVDRTAVADGTAVAERTTAVADGTAAGTGDGTAVEVASPSLLKRYIRGDGGSEILSQVLSPVTTAFLNTKEANDLAVHIQKLQLLRTIK